MHQHTYTFTREDHRRAVWIILAQSAITGLYCAMFLPWLHALFCFFAMSVTLICWEVSRFYDWEILRLPLTFYMLRRYGCHGGLKPPIAPFPLILVRTGPRWWFYSFRRWCYRIESRLYNWTGLPERWHRSYLPR